ncbi:MAG: hydantoinase B/oxoprolinase family protein, partial [Pseudomonadota bacterium]
TFLEPMTASMLSLSREIAPFGVQGGKPGKTGRNRVIRAHGEEEVMENCFQVDLDEGDRLIVETPGGGGYGNRSADDK